MNYYIYLFCKDGRNKKDNKFAHQFYKKKLIINYTLKAAFTVHYIRPKMLKKQQKGK